ncbi:MAG: hypothetical protein GY938_31020 [Ketobacter sp.]|nr:hypothetical protein [Ketobacter sp.]
MVAFTKFNQFVEDIASEVHNFGADSFMVALCASANAPVVTNSVLANLTQISYANLSTRALTLASSGQTSGVHTVDFNNLTLTASGAVAAFRYVVIYNDTPTSPADPLIAFADYGADLTMANTEQLAINFNASGFFTLT